MRALIKPLAPGEFFSTCPFGKKADKTAPCRFTTADKAAWEQHFKDEHNTSTSSMVGFNGRWSKRVSRPWKAPTLTEAGTHFDPQGQDPGAQSTFEYRGRIYVGTVWSKAGGGDVWVTVEPPIEGVRFVRLDKRGDAHEVAQVRVLRKTGAAA